MIIGNNIKILRSSLDMTAQEFADLFNIKRHNVESYEQDRGKPKAEVAGRICNYFGITTHQLFEQKLSKEDIRPTGRIKSVVEVQLEEALKRIVLLEKAIADKDKIIELLEKRP